MLSLRGVREFVKPAEINPSNLQCYAVLVSLSLSLSSPTHFSLSHHKTTASHGRYCKSRKVQMALQSKGANK